jgi:hypothetical protein
MRYLLLLILFVSNASISQEYAAKLIPDSLKENADAVLRMEHINVNISAIDKAVVKHKYVITILNENADEFAKYENQYDDLISLSNISATLYDANGIKIKSLKRREIYDVKSDGGSFLTDSRAKFFSFQYKNYPYSVEFEDEQTYNGIYHLPTWSPVRATRFAVQQSKFSVEVPLNYELRYKQINVKNEPILNESKKRTLTWELLSLKSIESEIYMPTWSQVLPAVLLAPTKFSIEGFEGDMSSWNNFGKFHIALNRGRNTLPDNIKTMVHQLTDNIKNDEEKVRILYDYLQKNTRYISIQLGIGGWQPLPASFVAEKKYGDCKALSNFMVCMLKEANVKAFYTIINSGENAINKGLDIDFPVSRFNHIITCVPLQKDTIWLECTSQTVSAGFTGLFTGNRQALVVTDSGGVVVSTPRFIAKENIEQRNTNAELNDKGDLIIKNKTVYTGILQEYYHDLLTELSEEQRLKILNKTLDLPTYTIDKLELKEVKNKIPQIAETIDITASSYAAVSGKRMFVVPNIFNKKQKLANDKPRVFDIVYKKAYTEIDSIDIKVPTGYVVEMMPKNIDINNKFGTYKIRYSFTGDIIKAIRYYEQEVNSFPASDFTNLVKFYDDMYKADRAKVVLMKKES